MADPRALQSGATTYSIQRADAPKPHRPANRPPRPTSAPPAIPPQRVADVPAPLPPTVQSPPQPAVTAPALPDSSPPSLMKVAANQNPINRNAVLVAAAKEADGNLADMISSLCSAIVNLKEKTDPANDAAYQRDAKVLRELSTLELALNAANSPARDRFKAELVQVMEILWDNTVTPDDKMTRLNHLDEKGKTPVNVSTVAWKHAAVGVIVGAVIGAVISAAAAIIATGGIAIPFLIAGMIAGVVLGFGTGGLVSACERGIAFWSPATPVLADQDVLKNFTDQARTVVQP